MKYRVLGVKNPAGPRSVLRSRSGAAQVRGRLLHGTRLIVVLERWSVDKCHLIRQPMKEFKADVPACSLPFGRMFSSRRGSGVLREPQSGRIA
jgi:hypothetical protein